MSYYQQPGGGSFKLSVDNKLVEEVSRSMQMQRERVLDLVDEVIARDIVGIANRFFGEAHPLRLALAGLLQASAAARPGDGTVEEARRPGAGTDRRAGSLRGDAAPGGWLR